MSSARLGGILSSGILNNRIKITDMMKEDSGFESILASSKVGLSNEEGKLMNLFNLSVLHSSLFATILEDTIMEIRILGKCNNSLHIMKTMADMPALIAQKYSLAQPAVTDELGGIDRNKLWKEEYKLDKLARDRKFFYDTMLGTYLNLSLSRSFECVAQQIAEVENRENHYDALCVMNAELRSTRRETVKQLRVQRIHMTSANYDVDIVIDNLKSQVEDAGLNAEIQGRYITSWERARTEQHQRSIEIAEGKPIENINEKKQRIDGEHRVHAEVMLLINLAINEAMQKVEEMMDKYDKDMEALDLKIQIMRQNHVTELEKRKALEARFEKQDTEAKAWINFKEERQKERDYREKMTKAAVVAQAWWRGLLVRLQLGPYRVSKKQKAGKGKK